MKFEELGLAESLVRSVRAEGYHTATPIQLLMTSDWRGARCARPPCEVEEG